MEQHAARRFGLDASQRQHAHHPDGAQCGQHVQEQHRNVRLRRHVRDEPDGQRGRSAEPAFPTASAVSQQSAFALLQLVFGTLTWCTQMAPSPVDLIDDAASQIRFFYHLYGPHIGDLAIRVAEEDPCHSREGKSSLIWRKGGNWGNMWHRGVAYLPQNIKNWSVLCAPWRHSWPIDFPLL